LTIEKQKTIIGGIENEVRYNSGCAKVKNDTERGII